MSYEIHCGDVMPGCPATFRAETQDELIGQVAGHASDQHDLHEITPEVAEQVKAAIHTV